MNVKLEGDGWIQLEEGYEKSRGHGTSTEHGYSVEARCNSHEPRKLGEQIFDKNWRRVHFIEGAHGVPNAEPFRRLLHEHGYHGLSAAQALRWWFHAQADAAGEGLCLESRLVRHKITQTYSIEAETAWDFVDYRRGRV